MTAWQDIVLIMVTAAGSLTLWLLKSIHDSLAELRKDVATLAEEVAVTKALRERDE